jgi:hypothetical protein
MRANRHTPESAARAVRSLFHGRIATTWDDYEAQAKELAALAPFRRFVADFLSRGQTRSGTMQRAQRDGPVTFRAASLALETVIPELFAEHWMALPMKSATDEHGFSRMKQKSNRSNAFTQFVDPIRVSSVLIRG